MKPLCVASIPGSGTWFTYYLLPGKQAQSEIRPGHKYLTHFTDPGHTRFLDECFIVIPVRARDAVEESWRKRGWNTADLERLWPYMEAVPGFHLQIDSPQRNQRLGELSSILGVPLATDWVPANRYLI